MSWSDSQVVFGSPSFGRFHLPAPAGTNWVSQVLWCFSSRMPCSFPTPADPRQPHPWRLLCFGFWNTHTIAACFFNIDEAVSSFRECGLPYGPRDSLCTLQPFRSALTPPPHGCNTRYDWLVRPYSTGTFTQSETPSFSWRTGGTFIDSGSPFKSNAVRRGGTKLGLCHSSTFRPSEQRRVLVVLLAINISLVRQGSLLFLAGCKSQSKKV
jgi:hypothetical protein